MKISTRARYALRLMVDLCQHADSDRPIHLKEIADRTELSRRYLEQLATSLKNASLLRSFSGRKGGYKLVRSADEIGVLEIIEAAIGPISISNCVVAPDSCARSESCECNLLWSLLNHRIKDLLGEFSLAEITHSSWRTRIARELEGEALS